MAESAVPPPPYNDCHAALRRFGLCGWRWREGLRSKKETVMNQSTIRREITFPKLSLSLPPARQPDQPFALIRIPKARSIFDIGSLFFLFHVFRRENKVVSSLKQIRKDLMYKHTRNKEGSAVRACYSSCPREWIPFVSLFGFSASYRILTNSQLN
jgi:hypothetical protein